MRDAPEWIMVGRIRRAHGKIGELLVEPLTDNAGRFTAGAGLHVARAGEDGKRFMRVTAARPADKGIILRIDGVSSREAAKGYAGAGIFIPVSELKAAAPGAFYSFEIEGCRVFQGGEPVGTVTALEEGRANPYLQVEGEDGTVVLIPFVKDVVDSVDTAAGRIDIIKDFIR